MALRNSSTIEQAERTLIIERVFDAPRETVWKAWTDPRHAAQWWAPKGFTVTSLHMDVRPGGVWRRCLRSPEGTELIKRGTYREIVEPERLVFTYADEDTDGKPGHETLVTVTFADLNGKTRLTLHQAVFGTVGSRDAHQSGWAGSLERLAEYVAEEIAEA